MSETEDAQYLRKDSPIIQCPTPPHSPTAGSSQLFPQENQLAAGGSPKYGHDPQEGMSKYGHGPQDGMLGVKPRDRYPSSNNGEAAYGNDVDSSTELWGDEEEISSTYTDSLKLKIKHQAASIIDLKSAVKQLEQDNLRQIGLEKQLEEQREQIREQEVEIGRLEGVVEQLDNLNQENDDLKLLLRLKDEEIKSLIRDMEAVSARVSDYNEIETHNTDLQSELFARDREVMALKHSEERLKVTYLELVKRNATLENQLLIQDGSHESGKKKFELSIMKLTTKLIEQRKKCEDLEQANARSVRDCRLAVRLLQCTSPATNTHASKLHASNKLSFLFGEAGNKPISSADTKYTKQKKELKLLRDNSFDDDPPAATPPRPTLPRAPPPPKMSPQTAPPQPSPTQGPIPNTPQTPTLRSVSSRKTPPKTTSPRNYRRLSKSASTKEMSESAEEGVSGDTDSMRKNHSTSCLENTNCAECVKNESLSVLKDLLQGKKEAIHVLRVELGKRDKEIGLLRRKLTQNLSESVSTKNMAPSEQIKNLETRVGYLNDENFNLKYQLEICRKMLDKVSGVQANSQ